jgi:hypothetical protein
MRGWSNGVAVAGEEKQIPFGNDKQEKQRQKQILRCAQDDNIFLWRSRFAQGEVIFWRNF